jgi:quinol monooxygenase YgiN
MRLRRRHDDDWEDGRRARSGGWYPEGPNEDWADHDRGDMPVPGGSGRDWPGDGGWAGGDGYWQEAGRAGPYAGGYADQGYGDQGYGAAEQGYGRYDQPGYGQAYGDPGYGDPRQGGYGQQAYNGTMGGPPWDQPNAVSAPAADLAGRGGWNGEFAGAPASAQYGHLAAREADLPVPEFTPASAGPAAGSSGRPYGRLSIFTLLDDKAAEFDRLAERAAEGVRTSEPDTLVYVIHVVPKAPMQRIIYEIYRDRAAFEHHEQQAHIHQFVADRRSCVLATNIIDLRLKYAKVAPLQGTPGSSQPRRGPRVLETGNRPAAAAGAGWAADPGDGRYPPATNGRYAQAADGRYAAAANGQYAGPANGYPAADPDSPDADGWFQPGSGYPQDGGQYQGPGQGGRYRGQR